MTNQEKLIYLNQYRSYLIFIKTNYGYNDKMEVHEKEKVKVKVLKKQFYGRDLVVG